MRPQLFQTSVLGTAVVCTLFSFAIAASMPDDAIAFVAWRIAVVLGVPASVLPRGHVARAAAPTIRLARRTVILRLLGALSVLVGVWALAWRMQPTAVICCGIIRAAGRRR